MFLPTNYLRGKSRFIQPKQTVSIQQISEHFVHRPLARLHAQRNRGRQICDQDQKQNPWESKGQANLFEKNEKKMEHQKLPVVVDRKVECLEDSYPQ